MNMPAAGAITHAALLTDLHQLVTLNAYQELDMQRTAVFEFFVRRLPANRNFLVAAGLQSVLDYLQELQFLPTELEWLESTGRFNRHFLDWLADLRFAGDVYGLPEGTVFFADEPVVRIIAPLPQAQLIGSRLTNLMHFQISVASKAARYRIAAGGKTLIDSGMRHAHGAEAALLASRAAFLAGFNATTNLQAACAFGIPTEVTMTHAFVQAHASEQEAFDNFARCSPADLTLVLDTFDIEHSARKAVKLAAALIERSVKVRCVRIDSGNLAEESQRVRTMLDAAGFPDIAVEVSGSLEEHAVAALTRWSAPVDSIAIDSRLDVSSDSPVLDCSYNLQEYDGIPSRRKSVGKSSWPGRRQVYRSYDDRGLIGMDMVCCVDEILEGKALLQPVMVNGKRRMEPIPLEEIRRFCVGEIATLPEHLLSLDQGPRSPVKISEELRKLTLQVDRLVH